MRVFLLLGVATAELSAVRKVIKLLDGIKDELKSEGAKEAEQFEAYGKWASENKNDKEKAIEFNTDKIEGYKAGVEQFGSANEAANAAVAGLAQQLSENEKDTVRNNAILKQQAKDFEQRDRDFADTIDELERAHSAVSKGAGALVQKVTPIFAELLNAASIDSASQEKLASMMQTSEEMGEAAPGAGDLVASLLEEAKAKREEATKTFMNTKHEGALLALSLKNTGASLEKSLDEEKSAAQSAGEGLAAAKKNLGEAEAELASDKKFLADVISALSTKEQNFNERVAGRSEEAKVIEEAKQILSGSKAQMFLQTSTRSRDMEDMRVKIASMLQKAAARLHSTGLAQLALRTRVGDDAFSKVKGLIEAMIKKLQEQAAKENAKQAYCVEQAAEGGAKKKKHSGTVRKLEARFDKQSATIADLNGDIAELSADIQETNSSRAEASELRQKESATFKKFKEESDSEISLLQGAISTLTEYYGNKALIQEGGYVSKVDKAGGIVGLLEVALSDSTKALAEAEISESNAAKSYERNQQEGAVVLAEKGVAVKSKKASVVELQSLLQDTKADREGAQSELDAALDFLEKLRDQCTRKVQTFEERVALRQGEIESLKTALDVLETETSGSFLQRRRF